MPELPSEDEIVARALGYPFPRPPASVLLAGGRVLELAEMDPDELRDRTPVLAYGSNASPESLGWKFPGERAAVVPLLRGALRDLDVVYSSHIAVYGSVPATLQRSPGTEVETFVAYLTAAQLELVAGWEINARYEVLGGVELTVEGAAAPPEVGAFVSRHGCLTGPDGREIALAEVPASDRRFHAMTQPEVLHLVRDRVAPGTPLTDFIVEGVRDYDVARRHTAVLRAGARALDAAP
jgi:hypothetical protein